MSTFSHSRVTRLRSNCSVVALLFALILLGLSSTAWAHHPLDGIPMQYFWHGLLSGVAHPVLGIDHLFFIIAIAVTGAFSVSPFRTLGVVLAGVFAGVLLVSTGFNASWFELAVALSLVVLGLLLFSGMPLANAVLLPLLCVCSVFHGYVYGQALTAQSDLPAVVVLGFLAGLPIIYSAAAFASQWVSARLLSSVLSANSSSRFVGILVALTGLAFV